MAPSLGSTLEGAVSQSPTWSGFSITKEPLRPPMKSLPTHWIRLEIILQRQTTFAVLR